MSDAIVTQQLLKIYNGKPVVDRLDLRVPRGAIFAFLGDNGAGKTTTIKILTGQTPADAGRASVAGLDCWADADTLRHRIGYVPERPRFYDWMSVDEIGWFTGSFHKPGFLGRYRDWVSRLGLDGSKRLSTLSKGGYARVGLALALAPDPEVLLLDEPTSGLDLLTRREFLSSMVELAGEGRTILISSHGISEMERVASHVGLMAGGRLRFASPIDELKNRFLRIRLRYDGAIPDATSLGRVLRRERVGKSLEILVQDPDRQAAEGWRTSANVHDFESEPVGLEDIYAALMARAPDGRRAAEDNELDPETRWGSPHSMADDHPQDAEDGPRDARRADRNGQRQHAARWDETDQDTGGRRGGRS